MAVTGITQIAVMPISFQFERATSPNVQNTIDASSTSFAKYWIRIVPETNKEERAIPASIIA